MKTSPETAVRGRRRGFDRDEALAKALKVFWTRGYANASMAELTSAMGINAPSLYAAFGDKEALFREAVALYAGTEGAELWATVNGAASAREAVEGLLLATAAVAGQCDRPRGCLVALSGVQAAALPPGACGDVLRIRQDSTASLRERLIAGQAAGEIAAGADPAAIAAFYLTVQQGMTFRAKEGASVEELTATARAAMLAWDGLVRQA